MNISEVIIGITEFKSKLYEILSSKATKIIIKNNKPISAVMPYEEYIALKEQAKNAILHNRLGQDIILDNGVPVMATINKEDGLLCISLFIKMKTSGNYKLHHKFYISEPTTDNMFTTEELFEMMKQ